MGGFTDSNLPSPAPEYPPENNFDPGVWAGLVHEELKKRGSPVASSDEKIRTDVESAMKVLAFLFKYGPIGFMLGEPFQKDPEGNNLKIMQAIAKVVVEIVLQAGKPILDILASLTTFYTSEIVGELVPIQHGAPGHSPSGLPASAQNMFDGVLAPLMGLTSSVSPGTPGAGLANSTYSLGAIIAIHLHTWLMNIVGNVSGLGVLKWINSFDEVITGALNARSLGRVALKPYLDMFIANPLTKDLNSANPLLLGSASQLVKRYIRQNITGDQLKAALRKLGYDDEVVADMLLDTAKLLSASSAVYLVKHKTWTSEQAIKELVLSGYPEDLARAVFEQERNSLVDSQNNSLADDLLTLYKDHRMEHDDVVNAMRAFGFSDEEIQAVITRGAYSREAKIRLTLSQVKSLYQESLVDLDYVLSFLTDERYKTEDADLLVLLEFTKKEERDHTKLLLANIRRGTLEAELKNSAAADAARQKALSLLPPP